MPDPRAARRDALAADWAGGTPLADLAGTLDGLDDPKAETVADIVRPCLLDASWLDVVVARLARAMRDDPFLDPPLVPILSAVHSGLLLYRGPHVALFAGVGARDALAAKRMRRRTGTIFVPGQLAMVRALAGGDAALSLWRGGWRGGAVAEACVAAGSLRLKDGELATIDGREAGFVVEHAQRDLVWLQATIFAGSAPTACAYDAASLRLSGLGAAREDASRGQMLVTLLAELDIPEGDAFARVSRQPEPHVRWHAMRAWVAADAIAARGRLSEMAMTDPDAELRALAGETLGLIDARCPA